MINAESLLAAVAMKLCNFASLDPAHQERGVSGLGNASHADKALWAEFNSDWNRMGIESEKAARKHLGNQPEELADEEQAEAASEPSTAAIPAGRTESLRLQNVRLGQTFFRSTVLASYGGQCCMCRLACKALLVASHIVPWAAQPALRLDPRNGLCLCAMHDRAFDRGLVSVDEGLAVMVSRLLESLPPHPVIEGMFIALRDRAIDLPEKFRPSGEHLAYHRTRIYQGC